MCVELYPKRVSDTIQKMLPEKLIFSFCIFLGISFPEKCLFIAKTMNIFLINGGISTWRPYLEKHYQEGSPRTVLHLLQWLRLGDDVAQLSSGNFSSSDSFDFFTLEIQLSNFLLFEWVIRTGKERRRKRKLSCLKNAKSQENDCIALQNHLSVQSTSRFGFEILNPI